MRAEMVQVLTLEVNLGPAEAFAQIGAEKDGVRTPGVVFEIVIQLILEKGIVVMPFKGFGHFVKAHLQLIGDKLPAVGAEETGGFGSGRGRRIHGSFLILGRDTTTKNRDQYPGRGWMFMLCGEDSTTRHPLTRAPPPAGGKKVDGLNVHGRHDAQIRFSCQYHFRFFLFVNKDNRFSFLPFFGGCSTAGDGIFSRAC